MKTVMSDYVQGERPTYSEASYSSDLKQAEPNAAEEVDLDSLQKGLAKAMVLQWKSDHPDESLDDIILSATKSSGSYNDALIEKGIDKTLYDQWRYVKYKQSAPKLMRPKKAFEINLPERRARQPHHRKLNEAQNDKNSELNGSLEAVQKSIDTSEHPSCNGSQTQIISAMQEKIDFPLFISKTIPLPTVDKTNVPTKDLLNEDIKRQDILTQKQPGEKPLEDAKDSLARIKKLLEQNKRSNNETQIDIPKISSEATAFIKDLQNFTSSLPPTFRSFETTQNQKIENPSENANEFPKICDEIEIKQPDLGEQKKSDEVNNCREEQTKSDEVNDCIEMSPSFKHGTKNILDRWQNQPSESTHARKKLIVVVDDEEKEDQFEIGKEIPQTTKIPDNLIEKGSTKQILNQLLNNTDEGNSDVPGSPSQIENSVVEKGYTKQMLDKWAMQDLVGSSSPPKKKIEIREEDGSVLENEPIERSDVIKSGSYETPTIEKGFTKQLLNQWSKIPDIKVQSSKPSIVISEQDGSVAENEPVQRDDILRENDVADSLQFIQRGTTKSLLEKWKVQNDARFKSDAMKIIINEEVGRCIENDPMTRTDVVKSIDTSDEKPIGRGNTSLMLNKWENSKDSPSPSTKVAIIIEDKDGVTAENEPEIKHDVARETDASLVDHRSVVQQGTTKSLLGKWNDLQTATFKKENKPVIISESDGHVSENQPIERPGVVKAEEILDNAPVQQGITKSLVRQWKNINSSSEEISKSNAIKINEGDGFVAENEPTIRTDVLKEGDTDTTMVDVVKKGTTKALLGHWTTKTQGQQSSAKMEIVISPSDGRVAENEPSIRDDVVRESDSKEEDGMVSKGTTQSLLKQWSSVNPSSVTQENEESTKISESIKGTTKKLLNQWSSGSLISLIKTNQQGGRVAIDKDGGCIAENEPLPKRDDIFREDPKTEDQLPLRGQANMIKQQLISRKDESIKKEPIKICIFAGDEKIVAENEPVRRNDLAREEDSCEEVLHKKGFARSMVGFWNAPQISDRVIDKQAVIELAEGPAVFENNPAPSILQSIKPATESGVFENHPVSRQDVIREADCEPEIISASTTRNVRRLWLQKEVQSAAHKQSKDRVPQPVRFTPPRDKSPPSREEFKSTHALTLKNSKTG